MCTDRRGVDGRGSGTLSNLLRIHVSLTASRQCSATSSCGRDSASSNPIFTTAGVSSSRIFQGFRGVHENVPRLQSARSRHVVV